MYDKESEESHDIINCITKLQWYCKLEMLYVNCDIKFTTKYKAKYSLYFNIMFYDFIYSSQIKTTRYFIDHFKIKYFIQIINNSLLIILFFYNAICQMLFNTQVKDINEVKYLFKTSFNLMYSKISVYSVSKVKLYL